MKVDNLSSTDTNEEAITLCLWLDLYDLVTSLTNAV